MTNLLTVTVLGSVIANQVALCTTSTSRARGLLGRESISEQEGVLMVMPGYARFVPVSFTSIHMFGMRFPITVVFLDEARRVINAQIANPGEMAFPQRRAKYILELHPVHVARFISGTGVNWSETKQV